MTDEPKSTYVPLTGEKFGHLIALADAPILSSDGLRIVAIWKADFRGPQFSDTFEWALPTLTRATWDKDTFGGMTLAAVKLSCTKAFECGPVQVWKMNEPIPSGSWGDIFTSRYMRKPSDIGSDFDPSAIVRAIDVVLGNRMTARIVSPMRLDLEAARDDYDERAKANIFRTL